MFFVVVGEIADTSAKLPLQFPVRLSSCLVIVKQAVNALISVQHIHGFGNIGNRIEDDVILPVKVGHGRAVLYTQREKGKIVRHPLEHEAFLPRLSLLPDMADVLWGDTAFEERIAHLIASCHIRKADHVTVDQHANMVSLLQQLVQDAWQNAAFEGIGMDCLGLASVQATQSGLIDLNGEKIPALRGNRLSDGEPLTVYPGEVPARLPGQAFWQQQGF